VFKVAKAMAPAVICIDEVEQARTPPFQPTSPAKHPNWWMLLICMISARIRPAA
jgi:hypothetical protein